MRYAVVLAGGSGTRLWPLSRKEEPKQLIPALSGVSLLELAMERLDGIVDRDRRVICAGERHREAITRRLPWLERPCYLGEPEARDTLAALAFSTSVIARGDPGAVIGVFTSDHVIRPVDGFREIVSAGYALAESRAETFVTFGIAPTRPATGYGYLELGESLGGWARRVSRFREKPDAAVAARLFEAGPGRYLWNSGMFIFRADTLLGRLRCYEPESAAVAERIAAAWGTPGQESALADCYPALKKTSFDFGIMERAAVDPAVTVAALPMPLEWVDIGSWPAFATMLARDEAGNSIAAERSLLEGCSGTLLVSDDSDHLIAALGCEDLVVVHTARATLVCRKDRAEDIKMLQALVAERFGDAYA